LPGLLFIHQRLLLILLELLLGLFVLLFGLLLRLLHLLQRLPKLLLGHLLVLIELLLFFLLVLLFFLSLRPVVVVVRFVGATVGQDDELTARRLARKLLQRLMLRSGTHDDSERGDGGWGIAAGRVTECCEQVPVSEMLCATASCFSENRLSQADPGPWSAAMPPRQVDPNEKRGVVL
jgi:hypothetical protein